MSVIRVNKTKDYTLMPTQHLMDKSISLSAKGLLSIMISLPDDLYNSVDVLVSICKEDKTAVQDAIKELEKFGYIT